MAKFVLLSAPVAEKQEKNASDKRRQSIAMETLYGSKPEQIKVNATHRIS